MKRIILLDLLLILTFCLSSCHDGGVEQPRKFKQGDLVEFVVSGQKAQIIYVNHCRRPGEICTYEVRVFSPQVFTDTHVVGKDGPLTTAHIARLDYIREFELRKIP